MAGKERRKEHRYVVDAVHLGFGEQRFPVIDLSKSSARISCGPAEYAASLDSPARLEFGADAPIDAYAIEPRIIRSTDLYVVIGYTPPKEDWEAFIRRFDTFHVSELDVLLFD